MNKMHGVLYAKGRTTRRRRKKPWTLHQFMRAMAWPIGESAELELWLCLFRWLPALMFTSSLCILLAWVFLTFHAFSGRHITDNLLLWWLWAHICGDAATTQANTQYTCVAANSFMLIIAFILAMPYVIFRSIGFRY